MEHNKSLDTSRGLENPILLIVNGSSLYAGIIKLTYNNICIYKHIFNKPYFYSDLTSPNSKMKAKCYKSNLILEKQEIYLIIDNLLTSTDGNLKIEFPKNLYLNNETLESKMTQKYIKKRII
jgi:hypothetical protein